MKRAGDIGRVDRKPPATGLRLRRTGSSILLAIAAGVGAWWWYFAPASGAAEMPIPEAMRMQIPTMSTGEHQNLLGSGESAQERNALIPLAADTPARLAAFAEIPTGSSQYTTALRCLTQAVYHEAANEPELGKRAVAQVVLNRVRHPAYPNSVCGVVYEGANAPVCQFSFTCDGALLRSPLARQWRESERVAAAALDGQVTAEVGSATHYHADYVLPRWAFTLGKLRQIGRHIFYRFPGRAGNAAVFTSAWNGSERIPALDFARLRRNLAADEWETEPQPEYVAGLTVTADVKDRHAANDVGGRLDTTTDWRLAIPDPVQLSASYRSTVSVQAEPGAGIDTAGAGEARNLLASREYGK